MGQSLSAWYVANDLPGIIRKSGRTSGALLATALGCLILSGCLGSGDRNQFPDARPGDYPVEVTAVDFKPRQRVGETYDFVIEARNTGGETIPGMTVTIDLPGRDSTLAFAYRNRQPGVAQGQRPVWVVEEGYPKLAGTVGRGGANTASRRTFNFGEVEPGETAEMVWRVVAVQPGEYRLRWEFAAGVAPGERAVDRNGETPEGLVKVKIENRPRLTRINERGKVVPLTPAQQRQLEREEDDSE